MTAGEVMADTVAPVAAETAAVDVADMVGATAVAATSEPKIICTSATTL